MTPFYIPIFTWYEVSYLYQSMDFPISKLLPAWVLLTPLTWTIWLVLQEIAAFAHQLLSWTCCLIPSPEGCWSHSSASATYSSRSMSSLVCSLMPTSKQWLSLVVHCTYIYFLIFLPIMQCPMHAIHTLMHFKHNSGNVVKIGEIGFNENFPFKSLIFSWNSSSTQQLVDFIVLAAPGHMTI